MGVLQSIAARSAMIKGGGLSAGLTPSWALSSKSKKTSFASGAVPFLFLLVLGSWGLSQFLKLPTRAKDEARRRKKEGRAKFSLAAENEKMSAALGDTPDTYENVRVPGPRPKGRVAAP